MNNQTLSDITRGMHHAASTTSAMIAQQYIQMVNQYFDPDDDDVLKAKMAKVYLDDKHYMKVPLISLVAPKSIFLEKMHVSMSVKIKEIDISPATYDSDNSEATRTSFKVSLAPKRTGENRMTGDIVNVDMEFRATEPPEGIMRIVDQYTNSIQPIKTDVEFPNENYVKFKTKEQPLDKEEDK